MTLTNTRDELSNVIAGRTVDGNASKLPSLSFSKSDSILVTTAAAADLMLRILASASLELTPEARTTILWKLAAYVSKTGASQDVPSLATLAAHAAMFLAERPRLMQAKTGFGKIIHLSQQAARCEENRRARSATHDVGGEPVYAVKGYSPRIKAPPRPVLWLSRDRTYRLEELVHLAHLKQEGELMDHCLGWRSSYYWPEILSGNRRIYSLRRGSEHLATLTHKNRTVTELVIAPSCHDEVLTALADAFCHIDHIHGPLRVSKHQARQILLERAVRDHQPQIR